MRFDPFSFVKFPVCVVGFSCFNAFSRVDVRVDVKIPGGVNAYFMDLRGDRCVSSSPCRPIALFFDRRLPQTDTKPLLKSGKKLTSPRSSARSSILMTRRTLSRLIVD
jgi:ChAPs (Chs5p-Arf1p-binding proteins)